MDIVFLLDISGSVSNVYDVIIAVTRAVVQGLSISEDGVRVGVVTYSDNATVNSNLNTYKVRISLFICLIFYVYCIVFITLFITNI